MAKINRPNKKGAPPKIDDVTEIMGKEEQPTVLMNFRVDESFRDSFKLFATRNKISMKDLLIRSFDHYRSTIKN